MRSEVSLIQTIGRAARNSEGRVILYADKMTKSIDKAVSETLRRRQIQQEYNEKHGIIPKTINRAIHALAEFEKIDSKLDKKQAHTLFDNPAKLKTHIDKLKKEMLKAASNLEFEQAAKLRDQLKTLEEAALELS